MTLTLYRYYYMDDNPTKLMLMICKQSRWLKSLLLLLVMVVVLLVATMITFAVRANSEACLDGLQKEQKCRNITNHLEHQLTQAQNVLLQTEAQAAACNQTMVSLMASLEMEKAQGLHQQELMQKLQEEIETLKQKLQNTTQKLQHTNKELQDRKAELEQLRKHIENQGHVSTNSGNTLSLLVSSTLLLLSLVALLI